MAQAITDVKTFLEDARQAVVELAEFEKQEETLAQEEKKRLRVLETERKACWTLCYPKGRRTKTESCLSASLLQPLPQSCPAAL